MTHLMKLGPALPYESRTQCDDVVSTLQITDRRPSCPACADVYDRIVLEAKEALAELCRQ